MQALPEIGWWWMGGLNSALLQIPKVTPTRWEWRRIFGEESRFIGWDPWLFREKKFSSAALYKNPFI